jgi:HEAT repeat protein
MSIRARSFRPLLGLCLLFTGCGANPTDTAISQLQSSDVEVRRAAAHSLGEQTASDARAVAALTKAVADSDKEVRWLAIDDLAKIGPPAASSLPALVKALDDADAAVRLRAALAIQKIDPKNPNFPRVLIAEMRAGNGRVLLDVGAMGKDAAWAVPTLIELLSHQSPKVRALAAQALGRIGPASSDAKTALQRAASDPNSAVQSAAHEALRSIEGDKHADGRP